MQRERNTMQKQQQHKQGKRNSENEIKRNSIAKTKAQGNRNIKQI